MKFLANPAAPAAGMTPMPSSPTAAGAFLTFARAAIRLQGFIVALLYAAAALQGAPADASEMFPELRVESAYRGAADVDILSVAWYRSAPYWTRATRLEFAIGVIQDTRHSQPFAFTGPVWRLAAPGRAPFLEFSFGPAVLGGSRFDERELGGKLHFRSALALGTRFGRRRAWYAAVRVAHLSNGGLRRPNPGLDSIGLAFGTGPLER